MRIDAIISKREQEREPEIDYSYLSDDQLIELENLIEANALSRDQQQRLELLNKKIQGNVISDFMTTANLEGSARELFNDYKQFCSNNNYHSKQFMTFKKRLEGNDAN